MAHRLWLTAAVLLVAAGCRHELPSGDARSRDDTRRDAPLLDVPLLDAPRGDRNRDGVLPLDSRILQDGPADHSPGEAAKVCGTCSANTCCDPGLKKCVAGIANGACGKGGTSCAVCTSGQACIQHTCGPAACKGKCAGQSYGADAGTCAQNDCMGCCDTKLGCVGGMDLYYCGASGDPCVNCQDDSKVCKILSYGGECCDAKAHCADKCAGEDDGCGGTCPSTTCGGCCDTKPSCQDGYSNSACGSGGASCINCTTPTTCNTSSRTCS